MVLSSGLVRASEGRRLALLVVWVLRREASARLLVLLVAAMLARPVRRDVLLLSLLSLPLVARRVRERLRSLSRRPLSFPRRT